MTQDNMSALSGLASFAKLEELLEARSQEGSTQATLPFEAFEVDLGHAMRHVENELKAIDLARYDIDADAVVIGGKARGGSA